MIISNRKGSMMINMIDKNNDSPAHLASFCKHYGILILLAKNNAFLDQPNAEGKSPLEMIKDSDKRTEILDELSQLDLTSKTIKHIKDLKRKQSVLESNLEKSVTTKKGTTIGGSVINSTRGGGGPRGSRVGISSPKKKDLEKLKQYEEKEMSKGLGYFQKIISGRVDDLKRDNMSYGQVPEDKIKFEKDGGVKSPRVMGDDLDYVLPMIPNEIELENSRVVTALYPGRGFFYLPKTTGFDREMDITQKAGMLFEKILLSNPENGYDIPAKAGAFGNSTQFANEPEIQEINEEGTNYYETDPREEPLVYGGRQVGMDSVSSAARRRNRGPVPTLKINGVEGGLEQPGNPFYRPNMN